jgi:hypothetical protein
MGIYDRVQRMETEVKNTLETFFKCRDEKVKCLKEKAKLTRELKLCMQEVKNLELNIWGSRILNELDDKGRLRFSNDKLRESEFYRIVTEDPNSVVSVSTGKTYLELQNHIANIEDKIEKNNIDLYYWSETAYGNKRMLDYLSGLCCKSDE